MDSDQVPEKLQLPKKIWRCNGVAAYLIAFLATSVFFVIWNFIVLSFNHRYDGVFSEWDRLELAVVVYFGTIFSGLIILSLPWSIAVRVYRKNPSCGIAYFPFVGSLTMLILCSALYARAIQTFSLAPPYFECLVSAIQKQGACFICSGIVFGLTYQGLTEFI